VPAAAQHMPSLERAAAGKGQTSLVDEAAARRLTTMLE
jgi:hypothetical protein